LGLEPAPQIVGHKAGQVLDGLHVVLAQGHGHRQGDAFDFQQRVLHAQLAALGVVLGRFLVEPVAGPGLDLLGGVLVKALDGGDFRGVAVGHVLDRGDAVGDQQLGDDLVHVQGFLEQGGALGELALTALALLALGHDVDLPAGQLAGEAHVLAAPADDQRQLIVGHHHLDPLVLLVHHHLADLGGGQGVDDEGRLVRAPLDDVDLLALQLGDHRLHAAAAHADAGADGVDGAVVGDHRHLGAAARVAGHGADLDDPVVDLRHLLGEQLGHEAAVGAGQQDLRALGLAAHVVDVAADAVADVEVLARDRLVAAHDAFAAAQVDDDVAVLDPRDHAVDYPADPVLELLVLALALGLANLRGHHLAGHLGLHAAELERGQNLLVDLAHEGVLVGPLGVGQADDADRLLLTFLDVPGRVVVDNGQHALDGRRAGLGIDVHADVVLGAVAGPGALLDRLFDRLDDDLLVDRLLARDRL